MTLFDYPSSPGFKARDTAMSAAVKAGVEVETLRAKCLEVVTERGAITADECAEVLGRSVLSIRPRFSELARLGMIADSGIRRANESGRQAIAWRMKL